MATKALTTPVSENRKLDRRGFLLRAMGGLSLGFFLPEAGHFFDLEAADPPNQDLANAYIKISPDNTIKLMFGGCEMGQGTKTGLAQIMAEELFVDWNQIVVEQSLVDAIVSYGTGGSSGVSRRYDRLRKAGAAARELLILAAIDQTGDTNRDNYKAQSGTVLYPASAPVKSWTYGSLSAVAATKIVPTDLRLTDPSNFRLIGKKMPRVDIPSKVDGSAKYGIDIWSPDMVFAAVKHCPTFGGVLASTPAKPSSALAIVPLRAADNRGNTKAGTYNAVAVVATNTWTAKNLANSLSVSWTLPASTTNVDSAGILATAQSLMASGTGKLVADPVPPAGYDTITYAPVIEAQVAGQMGTPTIESTYTVPYVAHATMEVLNCAVKMQFDAITGAPVSGEIWASNQNATSVANYAAAASGLPASAFKVNTTYLGGGLGRKIEQDYISQAVQIALAVKKPVKLTWMREEDFTQDQYRPFAHINLKATYELGNIKAWYCRTVTPSITAQRRAMATTAIDSQAVECLKALPYKLGTSVVEWIPLPAGIPIGYWRSVGASMNVFAVESFIDELAKAAGNQDPFQFRYNLLNDVPDTRARNVLQAVDKLSSWRLSLPAGHAWGLAMSEAFGTWVAEVVEISVNATTGAITVYRVACAVDCGMAINPDSVEAQMQGGIVHGLNATLWSQTTFTAGKANQKNFNTNRMLRLSEMPQISVTVVQSSTTAPTGTGEPGVPPVAAAVANAYARLTGKRQYTLPFFPGSTMGGL